MITGSPSSTAGQWLARLHHPDGVLRRQLHRTYGSDPDVLQDRLKLLRRAVELFLARFGDRPVRLFRSPGRINLRGMHVDTHGGYLNLMTHQRELAMVATPSGDSTSVFVNADPGREEVSFDASSANAAGFRGDWLAFLAQPDLQGPAHPPRGHWGRYAEGCALRAQYAFPDIPLRGLHAAVAGDIPEGAALSSSAALCVAGVSAYLALNGLDLDPAGLILAARDAEWYAGSRCGVSDQAAMVLGGPGEVVNVALFAAQLDVSGARRFTLPEDLTVLVANSHTRRSLSGAEMLAYARNRFAYSLALEVLRHEMRNAGYALDLVNSLDRLARFSPEVVSEWRNPASVYALLARIPEEVSLAGLQDRYDLRDLDDAYGQYFGALPEAEQPQRFHLRGPLLYGLAESERARTFPDLIAQGDYATAGRLMSIGHDGDRRLSADGAPYRFAVDDEALRRYARDRKPLVECPGVYGASSPILDALVDTALHAGALGACLTGAGIAGTVLALCLAASTPVVVEALRQRMAAADYTRLARLDTPLTKDQLAEAVVANHATASALIGIADT